MTSNEVTEKHPQPEECTVGNKIKQDKKKVFLDFNSIHHHSSSFIIICHE